MMDQALTTMSGGLPDKAIKKAGKQPARAGIQSEAFVFLQVNVIVAYYQAVTLAAFWLFLDTWSNKLFAMQLFGLREQALADPLIPSMAFVIAGGILGSVLYNIRVLFRFYLKSSSYNYRWFAKYLSAPMESAAMALLVFALIQGGLALLGGPPAAGYDPTSRFAGFGLGSLVGFGMRDVVGWMGNLVSTMFVAKDASKKE